MRSREYDFLTLLFLLQNTTIGKVKKVSACGFINHILTIPVAINSILFVGMFQGVANHINLPMIEEVEGPNANFHISEL